MNESRNSPCVIPEKQKDALVSFCFIRNPVWFLIAPNKKRDSGSNSPEANLSGMMVWTASPDGIEDVP